MGQKFIDIAPEKFRYNKKLGIYLYPEKSSYESGETITDVHFSQASKLAEQHGLVIPTLAQWGNERERLRKLDEKAGRSYDDRESLERDYIRGEVEFTGSILDFTGKTPVLWEGFRIEGERFTGGKRTDVKWLPKHSGYIQDFDEELGLPTKLGDEPRDEYHGACYWVVTPGGVRTTLRGGDWGPNLGSRFNVDASYEPSVSDSRMGFRVASENGKVLIPHIVQYTLKKKA